MTAQTLKLIAKDAQDIQVMAAVLQDAIAPVADMAYRAAEGTFVMVVQRFCWDCGGADETPADQDEPPLRVYERVNCALDIQGVKSVQYAGIDPMAPAGLLDLLTMTLEAEVLTLIFAGGGKVRIKLEDWQIRLRDFGESWPTTHCPRHAT